MRLGWPTRLATLSLGALLVSGLATVSVAATEAGTLTPSPAESGQKHNGRSHDGKGGIIGYKLVNETFDRVRVGSSRQVSCPEGTRVLGGGASVSLPRGVTGALQVSGPLTDGSGWIAQWNSPDKNAVANFLWVAATCAKVR